MASHCIRSTVRENSVPVGPGMVQPISICHWFGGKVTSSVPPSKVFMMWATTSETLSPLASVEADAVTATASVKNMGRNAHIFATPSNDTNYPGRICTGNSRIVPSGLELQQSRGQTLVVARLAPPQPSVPCLASIPNAIDPKYFRHPKGQKNAPTPRSIRIGLKKRGGPTHRIELIRQPVGKRSRRQSQRPFCHPRIQESITPSRRQ